MILFLAHGTARSAVKKDYISPRAVYQSAEGTNSIGKVPAG
jgi:hypothetical protein